MAIEETVNRDEQHRRLLREASVIRQNQHEAITSLHHAVVVSQDEEPSADDLAVYPKITEERQEHRRMVDLLHQATERARVIRERAKKAAHGIPKNLMAKAIARVEKQGHMGPSGLIISWEEVERRMENTRAVSPEEAEASVSQASDDQESEF